MKFTLSWLKDHLETEASLDEIVETLTMIGLEVEDVDDRASFQPFTIAKVLTAGPHPDADKLRVLTVDKGDGQPIQVVCGAPNARAGLIGAFAGPGTYVPGIDVTLGVGNIRGVESFGMMCSERELELSDEHDGIIDLPEDAPVGTPFADYAGLNDPVIEIGITPNRPDALGVAGIAADLAAAGLGTVITPEIPELGGEGPCPVDVDLSADGAAEFCPAFGLRLVRNVKNGPSPKWMQQRLKAIGLRPISALVDITNYVTFDRGRPLHVFDADKVKGNLAIRRGTGNEEFLALDGKTYKPTSDHFVIADENGPESLAGIMGGEKSGCSLATTNVLVESALWDPLTVAKTGRELSIITDARYRFERGVDPAFNMPGLDYGSQLVIELCGGEPTLALCAGEIPQPDLTITYPVSEAERLTGVAVSSEESAEILSRLGFDVSGTGKELTVKVPGNRPDVHGKADLVEEIMRIRGINNIEPQPLPALGAVGSKILTTGQTRTRNSRRALAARGMSEAVCYSFIPRDHAIAFGGGDDALTLTNPIASDMSDMRPSLLPSLLAAAKRNADRGLGDLAIFEVSHVYQGVEPEDQFRTASGIRRGTAKLESQGRSWVGNSTAVSWVDAKEDALAVLAACGMDPSNVQIEAGGPDWYHPGRSGTIKLGPKVVIGTFGEFHPMTLEMMDVTGPLCGFEINLQAIPAPRKKAKTSKGALNISALQPVKRDFAFVMDKSVEASKVLRAANGADKKLITDVAVFDLFEGASIGDDKKSLAIEVTLQPTDRSLTDEEIDAVSAKVVENVAKTVGGVLRG
ncbi:MAG: phenylalanine--tRNA ligase subunit beta [Hyphomicrobiales bacterium]|nr:phenylalanine--tRNA ligase subunit beta [Hyphomicrobiales bacterium]